MTKVRWVKEVDTLNECYQEVNGWNGGNEMKFSRDGIPTIGGLSWPTGSTDQVWNNKHIGHIATRRMSAERTWWYN